MSRRATGDDVIADLSAVSSPVRAKANAWFFKTGKGEYGEGDKFLGVAVPRQRIVAKKFASSLALPEVRKLMRSPFHEVRLTACIILVYKFGKAKKDPPQRKDIYQFYWKNRRRVNNWDLVDTSTPHIVGAYMREHPAERKKLWQLARSENLWERRMSLLATAAFIDAGDLSDTLRLAKYHLRDKHDLMHKAAGWMLREVGKKDMRSLLQFLDMHSAVMPRTMLRYSIEKLPLQQRKHYLLQKR